MCSVNVRDDTRAHAEMKRRFLFKGRFIPRWRVQKAACALRRKTSPTHGSLENQDPAWRGVRSRIKTTKMGSFSFLFRRWTSRLLVFEWFRRHSQRAPALPAKETDVHNLRRGKRRSLRHLSTIRPERLPPTSGWREPEQLPRHP